MMGDVVQFQNLEVSKIELHASLDAGTVELNCKVTGDAIWFELDRVSGDRAVLDELITALVALRFKIDDISKTENEEVSP